MCRAVEKLYNDGVKRGEQRGIERDKREVAKNLLLMGMPHEQVAKAVNLSPERIREIETECKDS